MAIVIERFWENYRNYSPKLLSFAITLLFVDVVLDPSNKLFRAKYLLFALVFLTGLPAMFHPRKPLPQNHLLLTFFVVVFMPFYALTLGLLSHFSNNTSPAAILYFNSFFFFLLFPLVYMEKIKLTRIFNGAASLVILVTGISYLILLLQPALFGKLYHYFVVDKNVAVYALRQYGSFTLLMMFYKTSPLLVFPLSFVLYRLLIDEKSGHQLGNTLLLFGILLSLFLSGTRANILSMALILLFYLLFYAYKKSKPLFVLLAIVFALAVFFGASHLGNILLNRSEVSNSIKLGHFLSYIEHFAKQPRVFVFGQGLGGEFYTTGLHQWVGVSELSYFELIRIWGFPLAMLFAFVLLIPLYKILKQDKINHLFIAYLAYLFIAGTNPLLLSSTGMLVLVYVFTESDVTSN